MNMATKTGYYRRSADELKLGAAVSMSFIVGSMLGALVAMAVLS